MEPDVKYASGTADWIDTAVRRRWRYLLFGLALFAFTSVLPKDYRVGFAILGFAVFTLGIYCVILSRWRSEPGLWMLALLLVVLLSPCFAYLEYIHVTIFFNPAGKPRPFDLTEVFFIAEISVSLHYFWKQIRLASSVAFLNRKLSCALRDAKRRQPAVKH